MGVAVENGSNEKDFGSDWDGGESFIKVLANIFYKWLERITIGIARLGNYKQSLVNRLILVIPKWTKSSKLARSF